MKIAIKDRQSIFDIAIKYFGKAEAAIQIALMNDLSLSDDLRDGQVLDFGQLQVMDTRITVLYASENLQPATALSQQLGQGGINFMGIELNFIIN